MPTLSSLLCEAGRLAGEVHKKYLQRGFQVEKKSELESDVVTVADKESEQVLRNFFAQHLPDYNIFGEEFGASYNGNGKVIVIDPLDGTLSFTKKLDGFGTVIAVYDEQKKSLSLNEIQSKKFGWSPEAFIYLTPPALLIGGATLERKIQSGRKIESGGKTESKKVQCVAGYVSNTLKGISYFGTREEGFHRHGLEEIIPKRAIFLGGAFSRDEQVAGIMKQLLQEEFPDHPLVMHTQQVTNRCRVYEGNWAVSLHGALAWHDIAPDPLFGQLTGCKVTDLQGNSYEHFDFQKELENYQSEDRSRVYSKPILVCQPKYFDGMMRVMEKFRKG